MPTIIQKLKPAVIFFAASLFLLITDSLGLLNWLHRGFEETANPLRQRIIEARVGLSSPLPQTLELERSLATCELRVSELEEENKASRRLLGANLPAQMKFQSATILGKDLEKIWINVGKLQKVKEGNLVISDNIYVGKVGKVGESSSEVVLLGDPKTRLLVGVWESEKSLSESQSPIVKGILKGGSQIGIEEILVQEQIQEGDLVASLDKGGVFLIGKVSKLWVLEDGLFKGATVEPLVDPRHLLTVFVVTE